MEPTNRTYRKGTRQICALAYILLLGQGLWSLGLQAPSVVCAEELQFPKDLKVSEYFCFFGSGGIDWQALHDPNNNPILVACIEASTEESLEALGIADLQQRLERLQRGNLIRRADGRYSLAFPAVVGDKRARLREYAEQAAQKLVALGEKMIDQIRPHLAGREEMLYHVLWSVIMDGGPAWDTARAEMNKKLRAGDTSIQNKAWLIYPSHPFRAGTNSYGKSCGQLHITWNRNTPSANTIGRVIGQYVSQLAEAIEQDSALTSADARDALGKYGLIDDAGKARLYTIELDSEAAQVYGELGRQFGRRTMDYLDVTKVAEMLNVSSGVAFVIAYHEICWQLLQELAEKKALAVPRIVAEAGTEASETYQLVSLTIIPKTKAPLLEKEMSDEEAQAIEEFRRIKARILAGESYDDISTPLHAVLTRLSTWEPGDREYFMNLDILRAPLPPEKPEEASLWPVFMGDKELADTFILVYSKAGWIWMGNMGSDYDWRRAKPTIEKMAREKIKGTAAAEAPSARRASEAPTPDESAVNRVLSLDGQGDYVRVADSQSLRSFTNAITIEIWFKVLSFYPDEGNVNSIIRKNITAGAENFLLRIRNIDGKPAVQMSVGYDIQGLSAPHEFAVDTWYHLAGAYDGNAITVFVNGAGIASEKVSGALYIDQSDLFIGRGDPEFSFGEYFHGALDEIRIWSVARSQEEIQAAMNKPLTGEEQGLVAYWNFDDGTAKDLSGHGNDGSLHGNARIVESPRPASDAPGQKKASKLIAWWKFENDANDSAGTNHGTVNGNPEYVGGKFGRAISLDGDDYVDCGNPDALNFGTENWTISAWIKTTQSGITDMDKGTVFANGADGDGGIRYTLAVNEGQPDSITLTTDSDIHKAQAIGRTAVNDGAWHHVVGARDTGQLYVYVDGELDGGDYLPGEYDLSGASQNNAYVGTITSNDDNSLYKYFIGVIDEVCIFNGALDANGVCALYSGEDPVKVAQTAVIELKARPRPAAGAGARGGIEGDWRIESDQISQQAIIEIRRKPDGTLTAAIVAEVPDEDTQAILLDEVTFENGRLHFEAAARQTVFDGTMKEDGSTIEGRFQQQGQMIAVVLKRIAAAPSEAATIAREQLQGQTSRTSNIATALILILALAGLVGGIVFFLVRSSIRR
jgi:hypothetical protein